jgi:hypothetical protein
VKKFSVLSLVLIAVFMGAGKAPDAAEHGNGRGHGRGTSSASGACGSTLAERLEGLPVQELDDAERSTLVRIREDEKLARDVYTTLGEKWNLPIFGNIARAEQRHMDHVALLLTRYEIEDPVVDDATGAFTDPELSILYTKLVAKGERSLEGALRVGATIEDLDLADLQKMIDASDNGDVHLIANNLAKGSRNHLRAYTKVLNKKGYAAYTAQYLSQDRVDEILAAEHERHMVYNEKGEAMEMAGTGGGCGKAKGQGRCKGQGVGSGKCQGRGHGQGKGKGKCQGKGQGEGRGCGKGARSGPQEG